MENNEIEKKRLFYRQRQKKYIENNNQKITCDGCFKKVKKYYFTKHLKSDYHKRYNDKNQYNNIIKRIETLEKKINKILI